MVAITKSDTTTYYDLLRDNLGSITHVVNSSTNALVAEYSYDAWGRMRNPATWVNYTPGSEPALFVAGRGYTGHEHLPWFSMINMNGRLYDPLIAMFLSPDNYVQEPSSTQNYNRFGYCLNNPQIYTDPSGDFIFTLLASIIPGAQFLLPLAISTDIGWMTGGVSSVANGGTFWEGAWKGAVTGAISGATSYIGVPGIIPEGYYNQGLALV